QRLDCGRRKIRAIGALEREHTGVATPNHFNRSRSVSASDHVSATAHAGRTDISIVAEQTDAIAGVHGPELVETECLEERTAGKNPGHLQCPRLTLDRSARDAADLG